MSIYKTLDIPIEKKIKAIKSYLNKNGTLREISKTIGVSHQTFWFWVKQYKTGGKESFCKNTIPKTKKLNNIEKEVIFIKEANPAFSIIKARQLLKKKSINISNKRVWSIWRKYGYANNKESKKIDPLYMFIPSTPEFEYIIKIAELFVESENYKEAAKILNKPFRLPKCPLLQKIPKKYLSLRRKFDCLYFGFEEISFTQYLREIRQIKSSLEKRRYIYSSITADFLELKVLSHLRRPKDKEKVLNLLSVKLNGIKDNYLKFRFHFERFTTYFALFKIKEALYAKNICRNLICHIPYPFYLTCFGDILAISGNYKKAVKYYIMALEKKNYFVKHLYLKIAVYKYNASGKYVECKKILSKIQSIKNSKGDGSLYSLMEAYIYFGQGNLIKAKKYFLESLEKAETYQLINNIYTALNGLAAIAAALNKKLESKNYLIKCLKLMKKYQLTFEVFVLKCLIYPDSNLPEEFNKISPLKLLKLFQIVTKTKKIGNYNKIVNYAEKKGILGLFHRLCFFFPDPIYQMIENGKETGLPKEILKYPLFNKKALTYHILFLGKLRIIKGKYKLKNILISPKDSAFLIHLSLRKQHKILLKDIYNNFWPKSSYPVNNLSHLLVRIKNILSLPSKMMGIKGEFLTWNFYFTTDYDDYKEIITHANAFERAGEWGLAKKEYLISFKLFHDKPFHKMYDNWSDEKLNEILFDYENEINSFTKKLFSRGRIEEAQRLLQKAEKIIT